MSVVASTLLTIWFLGFTGTLALFAFGLQPVAGKPQPRTDKAVAILATAFVFAICAVWPIFVAVAVYVLWTEEQKER